MIIVCDASAALEIALNRNDANKYKEILKDSDIVLAPDIYPSEISNALWKYVTIAGQKIEECEKALEYCLGLVDDIIETRSICREAFSEAIKQKHPVYDIFYLVIARRNNALLVSKDKKLLKIAKAMGVETFQ
jgi:predicted nucleic acid-binding protein